MVETYGGKVSLDKIVFMGFDLEIFTNLISFGYSILNFLLVQVFAKIAVWFANLENHKYSKS
jgi:hypothetical protein